MTLAVAAASVMACERPTPHMTLDAGLPQPTAATGHGGPGPEPEGSDGGSASLSILNGTYASAPGALYIPPDWKNVRWTSQESSDGVGKGTLTLTVNPTSKRVSGTLDGALGPAVVDGYEGDGWLSATVSRRRPGDRGFRGTLYATLTDAGAVGTIRAAPAAAESIRVATFEVTSSGSPATPAP
jgi:hypothetical protein